jgi:hypothetical protein
MYDQRTQRDPRPVAGIDHGLSRARPLGERILTRSLPPGVGDARGCFNLERVDYLGQGLDPGRCERRLSELGVASRVASSAIGGVRQVTTQYQGVLVRRPKVAYPRGRRHERIWM